MKPSERIREIQIMGERIVGGVYPQYYAIIDYLDEEHERAGAIRPDGRVICEQCKTYGQKSTVRNEGGSCTSMGIDRFYDEEGAYHVHDPNVMRMSYRCSRGHHWEQRVEAACWCKGRVSLGRTEETKSHG